LTFAKASAAKVHPLLLPVPHGNLWKLRLDLFDLAIDFPTKLNTMMVILIWPPASKKI